MAIVARSPQDPHTTHTPSGKVGDTEELTNWLVQG
jgi:hypothetical protein